MGPNAYPNLARYVFSKTLRSAEGAVIIGRNIKANVETLKRKKGKDIWLFGGAELTNSLISLDLIDEALLSVHPVVLGGGKPLFKESDKRLRLKLVGTKSYSTGLVQLSYRFKKNK
jgi:dihydrofolate reductase